MRKHFVYILEVSNGRYYVGYTTDLKKRMDRHKSGKGSKFVRSFGFDKLLYHESFSNKSRALKREAELKTWSRIRKQSLIGISS